MQTAATLGAVHMCEAAREVAALEVLAKLVFNVLGQRAIVRIACTLQEFAKMLAHQPVEHRLVRLPRNVRRKHGSHARPDRRCRANA
jgi:hypothetical protein